MISKTGITCIFCRSRQHAIVAKVTREILGPVCEKCVVPAAGNGFYPRPLDGTAPLSPRDGVLLVNGKIDFDSIFQPKEAT